MLPLIPFEILIPATITATVLCLSLIVGIIARRAVLKWWTRGGKRLTDRAEVLLRRTHASNGTSTLLRKWIGSNSPGRIDSVVHAVERIQASDSSLNGWVKRTGVPERLSEILVSNGGSIPLFNTSRWTRVAAAKASGRLRLESTIPALTKAMDGSDEDVGYAAADALSQLNTPESADVIMQRITTQPKLNNSRLASMIERMNCDLTALFREQLQRADTQALYWTTTLIGQKELYELVMDVRPMLASEDANVRAAACECIGELKIRLTDRWLSPLLSDEKWFVQSNAAKALGDLQANWAVPRLVELLTSNEWWVRQNAADALAKIGPDAMDAVEALLDSEDRFARNTSVEILERVGWIEVVLQRALRDDPRAAAHLRQFGLSGGIGYLENALFTVSEEAIPVLIQILREQGDDATYGRLRAAAEQMPEHLRPLAYEVAAEVRGR
jgi:HEAT repeat protein